MTPEEAYRIVNDLSQPSPFARAINIKATLECGHVFPAGTPVLRVMQCRECITDRKPKKVVDITPVYPEDVKDKPITRAMQGLPSVLNLEEFVGRFGDAGCTRRQIRYRWRSLTNLDLDTLLSLSTRIVEFTRWKKTLITYYKIGTKEDRPA